jgi:hypothetical protein
MMGLEHISQYSPCPPLGFVSRTAGRTQVLWTNLNRQPREEPQSLNRPCQIHPSFHDLARTWFTPPKLHLLQSLGVVPSHAGQNLPIGHLANCTGRTWNSKASKPHGTHAASTIHAPGIGGKKCDNAEEQTPKIRSPPLS